MTRLRPVDAAFVPDDLDEDVTAAVLCVEAGISYRQCDFWTTTGRLRAGVVKRRTFAAADGYVEADNRYVGRPGYQRRYSAAEVAVARLMRWLMDETGMDVQHAHDAARAHVADPDRPVTLGAGLLLVITDEDAT